MTKIEIHKMLMLILIMFIPLLRLAAAEKIVESCFDMVFPEYTYIIKKEINLSGAIIKIPENCTLFFEGGMISNGTLVGNNTQLKGKKHFFKNIHISGTWDVPVINSNFFVSLSEDNSLRDLIALSSPTIHNIINIEKGRYNFFFTKNSEVGISISDNTELIINGNLILHPNSFPNYSIISVSGKNIVIKGYGSIRGDKEGHLSDVGEWGFGIRFWNAQKSVLSAMKITGCWGDCIYVGGESKDIIIENCQLSNSRRQGISITSANNVLIQKCKISSIFGTDPQYGIDLEPNENIFVNNIIIDRVIIDKCFGGIMATCVAKNAHLGSVNITDCQIKDVVDIPVKVYTLDSISIRRCFLSSLKNPCVILQKVKFNSVDENKFQTRNKTKIQYIDCPKENGVALPISLGAVVACGLLGGTVYIFRNSFLDNKRIS